MKPCIIPFDFNWKGFYDLGEDLAANAAFTALDRLERCGAKAVRLTYTKDVPLEWMRERVSRLALAPMLVITINSVFTTQPVAQAWETWQKLVRTNVEKIQPQIIVLDDEEGYKHNLPMPETLREANDKLGADLCIYRDHDLWGWRGEAYSDAPCPSLYKVFQDSSGDPVVGVENVIAAGNTLVGGYPWASPFRDASKPDPKELVGVPTWQNMCWCAKGHGAVGLSLLHPPYTSEFPLDSSIHAVLLDYMRMAADVFDDD